MKGSLRKNLQAKSKAMTEIKISAEVLQEIKKFNRNVEWLKNKELSASTKWVRASIILRKTGWKRSDLATARRNNYINWKQRGKITTYDPDSINKDFLAHVAGKGKSA